MENDESAGNGKKRFSMWNRCVLHSAIIFFGTTCNIFFVSRQKK